MVVQVSIIVTKTSKLCQKSAVKLAQLHQKNQNYMSY